MRQIWIDIGFDEKLLWDYQAVRKKLKPIWNDARAAVDTVGTKAKRTRVKEKVTGRLDTVVDILCCR